MIVRKLLPLLCILAPLSCLAQGAVDTDSGWPRTVDSNGTQLLIYQPQVDSWQGNRLKARSAITITAEPSANPIYGIVNISARTHVDKESRLVTLDDPHVDSGAFPSAAGTQADLLRTVRESVGQWPQTISLDRLQASLAITQAEAKTDSQPLKNDPPRIIFSTVPAILILIDGAPVYRGVPGTGLTRIINTPALILHDSSDNRLYLDGRTRWMTAPSLNGPWTAATNPPAGLNEERAQLAKSEDQDPNAPAPFGSTVPKVFVSTTPAELLQTRGDPQFAPIQKTQLVYVTNTDDDIFLYVGTQHYYVLLAGRWFDSPSLNGPWQWVPGEKIPHDFSRIPSNNPKAAVLASVPGTREAREALVDNQIPQTAAVRRSEATLQVDYDGDPIFKPIEGTSMQYAFNADADVILVDGRYYAVSKAVWFTANSAGGPWIVADSIPAAVYTIPPSSPLYHVRYVYVYDATPDVVYLGYTPGYMGAFLSDGVVVFGTGWAYPSWSGAYYFGAPWTWGLGFQMGFWGGGWFWRPWGHDLWYHDWGWAHRAYYEHWHPGWRGPGATWARNNVNVYNRWGNRAVVSPNRIARSHTSARSNSTRINNPINRGAANRGPHQDLYAGRNGQVYRHQNDGWYQHNGGAWNRVQRPSPGLESERQSRALGESRSHSFHSGGGFSGVFRGGGMGGSRMGGGGMHGGGGGRR